MIKKLTLIFCSLMVLAFVGSADAASQKLLPTPEKKEQRERACTPIGKGAAMSAVARRTGGKVLSASLNMRSRPPMYRVRVLTDSGRVRHFSVNACNGRVS